MLQLDPSRLFGARVWHEAIGHRNDGGSVLIVNGHPDPRPERFCAALCAAFLDGAHTSGRRTDAIAVGDLARINDIDAGQTSAEMARAVELVHRSHHLTIVFPLWLDKPPPLLTGFFEQALQDGKSDRRHGAPARRFVHIIVTMTMPAFAHRSALRARKEHCRWPNLSLPGLETNKLDLIGSVDTLSRAQRETRLVEAHGLGVHVA